MYVILISDEIVDKIIEEKEVSFYVLKCGVSGPPETGKSHFRALMLNKRRPRYRQSTAVAAEVDQVTYDLVTEDVMKTTSHKWQRVGTKGKVELIARTICNELKHSKGMRYDYQQSSSKSMVQKVKKELKKIIGTGGKKRITFNGLHLVHFNDVGGQPQFQEILPNFVRCDFNILVHNLSQGLDTVPKFSYMYKGQSFTVPMQMEATNMDIMEQTARSICSNMSSCVESKPHIAIVGMFKDEYDPDSDTYRDMLQYKSKHIKKQLEPYIGPSVLGKSELVTFSREQLIFAVDGSVDGWGENDDVIVQLKQSIHNCTDKWSIKMPLKYVLFLEDLIEFAENCKLSHLPRMQCISIASKSKTNECQVDEALKQFDDLNLIFYRQEILPNIVFVKPSCLYQKTTTLIVQSFQCEGHEMNEDHLHFQRTGNFTSDLIRKCLEFSDENNFGQEHFLQLLQGLFIIAKVSDKEYFMPCVLPLADPKLEDFQRRIKEIKDYMEKGDIEGPLQINFLHKTSPRGLFCALVVALTKDLQWTTLGQHFRYRNLIEFNLSLHESRIGEVVIYDRKSHLDVYTSCDRKYCSYIRQAIHTALRLAIENMKYNFNEVDYDGLPCYISPMCEGKHSTQVVDKRKERCSVNLKKHPVPFTKKRSVWFVDTFDTQGEYCYIIATMLSIHS